MPKKTNNKSKNNKSSMIFLGIVVVVVIALGIFIFNSLNSGNSAASTVSEELRGNSDDFDRGEVTTVDEVFTKDNKNAVYYFYAPDCPHCNNIHDDVNEYFNNLNPDVKIYLVRLTSYRNTDEVNKVKKGLEKYGQEYQGTPSLYYFQNDKLETEYIGVGEPSSQNTKSVPDMLEAISKLNDK